jgi:squalene synthase HpnC
MTITIDELKIFCSLNIEKYNTQSLNTAYLFVKKIAKGYYENFPVGSVLIPKELSKYIYAIYTFLRIADDIADEISKINPVEALILLDKYENCLDNCFDENEITNPIFLSLKDTIIKNELPIELFKRLLTAFRQDINFTQPNTFDDIFNYCNYSANPVGELILRLFKENNDETIFYSNKICTALQLINFLQDLSVDLNRNRNYFPKSLLKNSSINKEILDEYTLIAQNLLNSGTTIIKLINNFRLRCELKLIILGGKIMLYKIKKYNIKLLKQRPTI